MSREIKFRAWDTERKEMSYDFLSENWLIVCIKSPYIELMQFTVLQDRNGTDIYEGDRLYHEGNLSDELQYVGDVTWNQADARWELHNFHGNFAFIPNGCIVQGNIYENPELLEVSQ